VHGQVSQLVWTEKKMAAREMLSDEIYSPHPKYLRQSSSNGAMYTAKQHANCKRVGRLQNAFLKSAYAHPDRRGNSW
jgi:hypothetical protein